MKKNSISPPLFTTATTKTEFVEKIFPSKLYRFCMNSVYMSEYCVKLKFLKLKKTKLKKISAINYCVCDMIFRATKNSKNKQNREKSNQKRKKTH